MPTKTMKAPAKMGRPPTGSRKINTSFYPTELAAIDKLVAERGTPRASIVAELAVQQLVDEGCLVVDEAGNVALPPGA